MSEGRVSDRHGTGAAVGVIVLLAVTVVLRLMAVAATGEAGARRTSLADVLGAGVDARGFERAEGRRVFSFPADHGAHPGYRSEWWYFTGNLNTADGRHFGYQLTLFRFALVPPAGRDEAAGSALRPDALFMGHFAITDTAAGTFTSFERFGRGAGGLAGATEAAAVGRRVTVFLDDWEAVWDEGRWRIAAAAEGHRLELDLAAVKPVTLQGDAGLSQKSAEAGNASWYYSQTRLDTHGSLTTPDGEYAVSGTSWLDREWSTSALSREQIGWDWFAFQLSDGSDIMFYRLRTAGGGADAASSGRIIDPDGSSRPVELADVVLRPGRRFESTATGARYPVAWSFRIADTYTLLSVRPRVDAQEHTGAFRYYEGAVEVSGRHRGRPVTGVGYIELTGY